MMQEGRPGYVLPIVVWSIAILALVASVTTLIVNENNGAARRLDLRVQRELQMASLEAEMLYRLMTEPYGRTSLQIGGTPVSDPFEPAVVDGVRISLRGVPYLITNDEDEPPFVLRLMSANGLLALGSAEYGFLELLLDREGVDQREAPTLLARLADYVDDDSLRRVGGAEEGDYDDANLPPNRPLRSPREICAVKGWDQLAMCRHPEILDLIATVNYSGATRPEFLSEPLLGRMFHDQSERADASRRLEAGEVIRWGDIGLPEVVVSDPMSMAGGVGTHFVFLLHDQEASFVRLTHVELTIGEFSGPYRVLGKTWLSDGAVRDILEIEDDARLEIFPSTREVERRNLEN